jgi:hypothetical protein
LRFSRASEFVARIRDVYRGPRFDGAPLDHYLPGGEDETARRPVERASFAPAPSARSFAYATSRGIGARPQFVEQTMRSSGR